MYNYTVQRNLHRSTFNPFQQIFTGAALFSGYNSASSIVFKISSKLGLSLGSLTQQLVINFLTHVGVSNGTSGEGRKPEYATSCAARKALMSSNGNFPSG